MMYEYGLDHEELGEQFFVLTVSFIHIIIFSSHAMASREIIITRTCDQLMVIISRFHTTYMVLTI